MHGVLKRFAPLAAGLVLTGAGLWYWARLQASPEFVALRGLDTLFNDPKSVSDLPLQPDELRILGLTPEKGASVLAELHAKFLPDARVISKSGYLSQRGKDALRFQVEVKPGVVLEASLPVIKDDGRGVIQFGDLVMVYRSLIWHSEGRDAGRQDAKLDEATRILYDAGIKGYLEITTNQIQPWPVHEDDSVASL